MKLNIRSQTQFESPISAVRRNGKWVWVGITVILVAMVATISIGPGSRPAPDDSVAYSPNAALYLSAGRAVDDDGLPRPLLPREPVRFISVDASGTVWIRVAPSGGGAADRVIAYDPTGMRRDFGSLREAVEANQAAIHRDGSVPDFWAVDLAGNVWVGPAFFDSRQWQEVALSESEGIGSVTYEDRVVIDRVGHAWIPYRIQESCVEAAGCESAGIAAFSSEGVMVGDIVVALTPELSRLGLPFARMETTADGTVIAIAGKEAFMLPSPEPMVFPGLEPDPATGMRSAGFASASTTKDGSIAAYTLVAPLVGSLRPGVSEVSWRDARWRTVDLGTSPLFAGRTGTRYVTAAVRDLDGRLWIASSAGELSARRVEQWEHHFTPENSPIDAGITDLAVGPDGTIWVGTTKGVRTYMNGDWRTAVSVYFSQLDFCVWAGPFSERECR